MGYAVLSAVQAQTLPVILQGHDVIAKAKTGTGKTIGFLLPTIERLVHAPPAPAGAIRAQREDAPTGSGSRLEHHEVRARLLQQPCRTHTAEPGPDDRDVVLHSRRPTRRSAGR